MTDRSRKNRNAYSFAVVDDTAFAVTINGETRFIDDLPAISIRRLALIGLRDQMRTSRRDIWTQLKSGSPIGRVGRPRKRLATLDGWRHAAALALVDETAGTDRPLTLDQAMQQAAEIQKGQIPSLRRNLAVLTHWQRLQGLEPQSVSALVTQPLRILGRD